MSIDGIRPGFRTVTPYLHGPEKLIEFAEYVFGAERLGCYRSPDGRLMHAELRIGDSMLELGDPTGDRLAKLAALHVYVPDIDAVYKRALDANATSLLPPTDMPYGDREGDIRDEFGNHWYIATHRGSSYIRENLRTLTAGLRVADRSKAIEFLRQAFGAEEILQVGDYAQVRLGNSVMEVGQASSEFPPLATALHCYVKDADETYRKALAAGAQAIGEPENRDYGERSATVEDDLGTVWYIAQWL